MNLRCCAGLFVLLILASTASAAEPTVGLLGKCERIEFKGNQAYTSDQLRKELDQDLEILVAGRSEAPLPQWLETLQSRIEFGYRVDGYAEVRAAAQVDKSGQGIVVEIHEGPLYHCGGIEFTGAKTLPVDRFLQLMATTRLERTQRRGQAPIPPDLPPKDTELSRPIWVKGTVAKCADNYWKTRQPSFRFIFKSLGYFEPQFAIRVRTEADKTATLIIDIEDEGPRSTLDSFEISGLTKNTPADLIKYLDIPLGSPLNLDVKSQIERKLWNSARFVDYHVSIVSPKPGDKAPHSRVDIVATEFDEAPPLSDPLSAEQQAFLRLFKWLSAIDESQDDLQAAVTWSSLVFDEVPEDEAARPADAEQPDQAEPEWFLRCRGVMSSKNKALFASVEVLDSDRKSLMGYAIHMTPNRLMIDSMTNKTRFEIKGFDAKLILNVDWTYKKGQERPERMIMGTGYATRRSTSAPFQVRAVIPPALVLHLFEKEVKTLELSDQLASVDLGEGKRFSFDPQTGLIQNFKLDGGGETSEISVGPDLYSTFIAKYEESMAGARVTTPGDQPVTSFVRFLCESIDGSPVPQLDRLSRFGRCMVERGSFRGSDALLNRYVAYLGADEFWIPDDSPSKLVRDCSSWAPYIWAVSEAVLPPKEVTRTVSREAMLAQAMRNYRESSTMADAFASGKTGPITDLLTSAYFQWLGAETPKAIMWSKEVTLADFHRDCDLLLNDDWAVGQLLLGFIASIQASDEDQIDDLIMAVSFLDEDDAASLRPLLFLIRSQPDKSPRDVVITIMDGFWDVALRPILADMLKAHKPDESQVAPVPKLSDEKPTAPIRR